MSVNIWGVIELELARREQLRAEQSRIEARSLLATCKSEIAAIRDAAFQQIAAGDLKAIRDELAHVSGRIESSPEQSLRALHAAHKRLHDVITRARAKAERWSEERAATEARIHELSARLAAETRTANQAAQVVLREAQAKLVRAAELHKKGRYADTSPVCREADLLLEKAAKAAFDESVRREVVASLIGALEEGGFVIEDPHTRADAAEADVVVLTGRLPSGRTARFEVFRDGRMNYDMNGYEGRACAAEVQRIEQVLHKRFSVKLGPTQVTWKNDPIRLAKGARRLPSATNRNARH